MRLDARELPSNHLIETDLCIIGAGPAGIAIAGEFTAGEIRVCLVESGGADIERRAQRLNRGASVGYSTYLLHHARVRAFGGSSRVTLLLHATATNLGTEHDPGSVDTVELRRDDGSRAFVRPRLVVLAAGGPGSTASTPPGVAWCRGRSGSPTGSNGSGTSSIARSSCCRAAPR